MKPTVIILQISKTYDKILQIKPTISLLVKPTMIILQISKTHDEILQIKPMIKSYKKTMIKSIKSMIIVSWRQK
jgi:hypothetical protein